MKRKVSGRHALMGLEAENIGGTSEELMDQPCQKQNHLGLTSHKHGILFGTPRHESCRLDHRGGKRFGASDCEHACTTLFPHERRLEAHERRNFLRFGAGELPELLRSTVRPKCESVMEEDQYCQPRRHSPGSPWSMSGGPWPARRLAQLGLHQKPSLSSLFVALRISIKQSFLGSSLDRDSSTVFATAGFLS